MVHDSKPARLDPQGVMVIKLTVVVPFYVALIMHPSKYMTSPVKVLHESTIASTLKL